MSWKFSYLIGLQVWCLPPVDEIKISAGRAGRGRNRRKEGGKRTEGGEGSS